MMTSHLLRESIDHSSLHDLRLLLQEYCKRTDVSLPMIFWESTKAIKREAVDANDQVKAKAIWCLETIGRVQDYFVDAYVRMVSKNYHDAWRKLERCETHISFLDRHFVEKRGEFGIEHCWKHTRQFQDLFQLKWGFSPGMLYREKECTICGGKIELRRSCGHRVGEIYDGRQCGRRITKVEIFEISPVDRPFQKYSVIFPPAEQHDYHFSLIRFVATGLRSPWHTWQYTKEERREHHPVFKDVDPDEQCPCGSGSNYQNCHFGKEALMPHYWIDFAYPPTEDFDEREIQIHSRFHEKPD